MAEPGKQNRIYEPTTKPCPQVTGHPQWVVINVSCQPKAQAQVRPHTFLKTIREKPVELTHCLHYLWSRPLKQHPRQEITIIPWQLPGSKWTLAWMAWRLKDPAWPESRAVRWKQAWWSRYTRHRELTGWEVNKLFYKAWFSHPPWKLIH